MPTRKAIELARERGLDLVEVSPNARPPVCKIIDYGRYSYELQKKTRESRKRAAHADLKEVQFRPKIGKHDYDFKMRHAVRFLKSGDRVKMVVRFRGRENANPDVGEELLMRAANDLKEFAVIDSRPRREGRIIIMILAPTKKVLIDLKKKREDASSLRAGTDKSADDETVITEPGEGELEEMAGEGDEDFDRDDDKNVDKDEELIKN
jgi:translation initiation factor IF-3